MPLKCISVEIMALCEGQAKHSNATGTPQPGAAVSIIIHIFYWFERDHLENQD
jgi:hypothetical protein